jgi:hypothetical protein
MNRDGLNMLLAAAKGARGAGGDSKTPAAHQN